MDRSKLDTLDRAPLIDRFTSDVHDATKSAGTDGDLNGETGVLGQGATDETLGTCRDSLEHDG